MRKTFGNNIVLTLEISLSTYTTKIRGSLLKV